MRQALHIFRKDARRLWPQIAAVAGLFAVYAFLSPDAVLDHGGTLLDWNGIPAALAVLACWTLGASAIQEDAPAEESPFWLTRPYDRTSLIGAKVLFLFAFIFAPLLLAGAVLEIRAGASVFANAGALLALCLIRSLWLILPALSLGVVTRGLLDFSAAALLGWVLLSLARSGGHGLLGYPSVLEDPLRNASIASVAPMIAAAIAAIGLQFAWRRTDRSRWYIFAGVLLSGLLASRNGVASFSLRVTHPGFDPEKVHVDFDLTQAVRNVSERNDRCVDLPLKVEGIAGNMVLRGSGKANGKDEYSSPLRDANVEIYGSQNRYWAMLCPRPFTISPVTIRTAVGLEVVETSTVATMPVRLGVRNAGDAGRCEVREDVHTYLRCTLTKPVSGVTTAALEYPGYLVFARGFGDAGTFPLGPILRQKFDGVAFDMPGGWPLDQALKRRGARFIFRNERVIGAFSRTLVYEGLDFPRDHFPLRPKPVSPPPGMPKK